MTDLWELAKHLGRAQQTAVDRRVAAQLDPECDQCLDCRDGVHEACQVCPWGETR